MNNLFIITLLGLVCSIGQASAKQAHQVCGSDQKTILSCRSRSGPILICGGDGKTFQVFVDDKLLSSSTDHHLSLGIIDLAGGGGAYLKLSKEEQDVYGYSAMGQGWGQKDGVLIKDHGIDTRVYRCRSETASEIGPGLLSEMHLARDHAEFLLP